MQDSNKIPAMLEVPPGRVLIVEDNPITRKMVRLTLLAEGHEVLEAPDGKTARDIVARDPVDLILLDLMLPDASGVDLVKEFRTLPTTAEIPIICFSGFISRAEETSVADAGFTDFLIKPVEPSKLALMVRNYLPRPKAEYAGQGQGRRVLIVDDDPVQLKLMRLTYECANFKIKTATNGKDALSLAESFRPDIIVSDILMPVMDGFQLCYVLRQHVGLKHMPLLLVSANYVEPTDREFTERLGANGYIGRDDGLDNILKRTIDILDSGLLPKVKVVDRIELDAERYVHVEHQLERQVGLYTACIQRAVVQSATLHELSMISETLARRLDFEVAMEEILAHCLDGAGLSKGALYLFKEGKLGLRAQYGLSETLHAAQQMFEESGLCEQIAAQNDPVTLPGQVLSASQTEKLLSRAHAKSALIVPIRSPRESLGVLMMFSSHRDLLESDWRAFGRGLAAQIAQTITLSRTFFTLSESEQRYRMLFEGANDGIIVTDEALRILETNPALSRLCGLNREDLAGKLAHEALIPEAHHPQLTSVIAEFKRNGTLRGEFPVRTKWGTERIVQLSGSRIAQNLIVTILHDVTEERLTYDMIQRLASTDALTDLANRTALDSHLLKSLHVAQSRNETLALLIMDMVDFRVINDTLGHQNGDLLLVQVAGRLKTALWESDLVARLGGDEFAVLLTRLARPEHISVVIDKIEQTLLEPFLVAGILIDVQMAIGVALYPDHGEDADTLFRHADIAMYAAKERQESSALYSPDLDQTSSQELALITELRQAIQTDQLVVYYQPVISVATGKPVGMEALVRWPHPVRGLIFPDQFIPMAEHTGLIHPLTLWVLRRALLQLNDWRSAGHDLYMSVNLSARDLQHSHIFAQVQDILKACDIPPQWLTLEITESAVMRDPERAQKILDALRAFGIKLSIDDFGIGHASLAYLKTLPVHKLKVDKSFVMELSDVGNAAIVLSVIELAHRLNLSVTAEGVEDQYALDQLKLFNCDTAQGYFICRPMPVEAINVWLAQTSG